MLKRKPNELDIKNYTTEKQDKSLYKNFISKMSNIQLFTLFSCILEEYSNNDLSDILDLTIDNDVKEELSDIWSFRSAHGLGE